MKNLGIDMSADAQSIVPKAYVDACMYLQQIVSNPMTTTFNMNKNRIKNVGTPQTHEHDAAINTGFYNRFTWL